MDLKTLDAKPIYLDYAATTPCDPCVVHAMLPPD
jgi:cysteine desulfurase